MCRRIDAIRAVGEAADKLTLACKSHLEAEQRVSVEAPEDPLSIALRTAFAAGSVTPTDMLHQLGKLK